MPKQMEKLKPTNEEARAERGKEMAAKPASR